MQVGAIYIELFDACDGVVATRQIIIKYLWILLLSFKIPFAFLLKSSHFIASPKYLLITGAYVQWKVS